jgi:uncharacterized membrane protein YhaH (DUF805 family)
VAGCALAGALICIALAVVGFFSLNRQIRDFQRVPVPGQAQITFAQPGGYVLYIESPGQCCSLTAGSGDSAPFSSWSMNVALQPVNGGPPVLINTWRGATESYGVAGHQGQTAMYVTVGRPGRYLLGTSNPVPRSITDVAVGRGIGHGALISLLLALVALFALIPAGLLVGGVTASRRRRVRRSLLQQVVQPMETGGPQMTTPDPLQAGPNQPGPYPSGGQPAALLTYLQGGPVGFGEAIKQAFRNGFVYRGRASRSAYWWFTLFQVIVIVAVDFIIFIPLSMNSSGGSIAGFIAISVLAIYLELVVLALLVRRLHDTDRSGWWVLIGLVPFVGPIALFVFTVLEGTPGLNRYQP